MTVDYELLKLSFNEHQENYKPYDREWFGLESNVSLKCFVCHKVFNRKRYRVIARLLNGVEHAFCTKNCASSWARSIEIKNKPIIKCLYSDFLNNLIPKRSDIAFTKRPLYSIKCNFCNKSMVYPWEHWRDNVRQGDKHVYCSSNCSNNNQSKLVDALDVLRNQYELDDGTIRSWSSLWNIYTKNASLRNLKWDLTYQHFFELIISPCYYCGEIPNKTGGVDRMNNKLGYLPFNVVPACKVCNWMKGILEPEDFIFHSKKIAFNWN